MIVDDLDVRRADCVLGPFEANAPLHVHANAELPRPVAFQGFKTIAGQGPQILETCRGVENFEALVGLPVETLKRTDKFAARKRFGPFAPVAQNHANSGYDSLRFTSRIIQASFRGGLRASHALIKEEEHEDSRFL